MANEGRISCVWNGRVRRERVRASGWAVATSREGAGIGSRIVRRPAFVVGYRARWISMIASTE